MTRNVAQRTTRLYYKGLFWLSLFLLSFHLLFYWIICAALPRAGPTISGLAAVYTPGQRVTAVCSTNSSLPAPRLAWYSDQQDLTSTAQLTTAAGPAGLLDTLSRLELTVNNNHCQVMQVTPLSSYNIITIGPRYSGQFKSQFSSNLASIPQPWTMDIGTGVCKWINLSQIILFVHTTEATAVVNGFALFTMLQTEKLRRCILCCSADRPDEAEMRGNTGRSLPTKHWAQCWDPWLSPTNQHQSNTGNPNHAITATCAKVRLRNKRIAAYSDLPFTSIDNHKSLWALLLRSTYLDSARSTELPQSLHQRSLPVCQVRRCPSPPGWTAAMGSLLVGFPGKWDSNLLEINKIYLFSGTLYSGPCIYLFFYYFNVHKSHRRTHKLN